MTGVLEEADIKGLIDALVMRTNLGRGYFEQVVQLCYTRGVDDGRMQLLRELPLSARLACMAPPPVDQHSDNQIELQEQT